MRKPFLLAAAVLLLTLCITSRGGEPPPKTPAAPPQALEPLHNSDQVKREVERFNGNLIRAFEKTVPGDGLAFYAVFTSPLTEEKLADKLREDCPVGGRAQQYDP